jgi:hypothetical protein
VVKNTVALVFFGGLFLASAEAGTLYSTLPSPLAVAPTFSWSYGQSATSEFGDLIQIDPTAGPLTSASVLLSNFAYESGFETLGTSTGYNVPVTLTLYSVGTLNEPGAVLATSSATEFVPWRQEPDATGPCVGATPIDGGAGPYLANGTCYSGASVLANFTFSNVDLSGLPSGQLIYGVRFNAASGPANSLNLGWTNLDPTVGSNPLPDTGYINTTNAAVYADSGTGGTGTFRQDQNYGGLSGAIQLSSNALATPEPGTLPIIVLGLLGLGLGSFRRNRAARSVDGEKGGQA